ncbi:MAG: ribose-phosphate pyrophosphokinase [Chlamydiota bacterium]
MQAESILFAGSSHRSLARDMAQDAGLKLGEILIEAFPVGEIGIQILENVRGRDTFVLQSAARHPNHALMELLIIVDALKRASARSIVAVMPYFPYARQDRKEKGRVPITAKLVANLLEKAGVTRLLTMDLHTEQIQGFFDIPVDHLYARPLLVKALKGIGLKDAVIVSPDIGRNKMARKFAEDLKVDLAIVDKRRVSAKEVEAGALIGSVKGKNAIIVDDIWSTGNTLRAAAKVCREEGAKSVLAVVSHALLVGPRNFEGIDKLIVTNTVPVEMAGKWPEIEVVSVAPIFGKAIDCVISAKSISAFFN